MYGAAMTAHRRWIAKHARVSVLATAVLGVMSARWLHQAGSANDDSPIDVCIGDEPLEIAPADQRHQIPTEGLPHKGAAKDEAKITMLVCSDFECRFCKRGARIVNELLARNDDLAFYHLLLPLRSFEFAMLKALAAAAAHRQGAFWPMHDVLYDTRIETPEQAIALAGRLGLDAALFESDLRDPSLKREVERQSDLCKKAGVRAVPTFFINGRRVRGARPVEDFQAIIDEERG